MKSQVAIAFCRPGMGVQVHVTVCDSLVVPSIMRLAIWSGPTVAVRLLIWGYCAGSVERHDRAGAQDAAIRSQRGEPELVAGSGTDCRIRT
jgi:hypothetical protein